jgi:hypothetical protein
MRYYQCICGELTSWSSMGTDPCARCSKCGSGLAEAPGLHDEPRPHRMIVTSVDATTDAGTVTVGTLTQCVWCHRTKTEIEKRNEPMKLFLFETP